MRLGLYEIERTDNRIYLGALEERDKYSLILTKSDKPGAGHLAFRVAEPDDLDKLKRLFDEQGCFNQWVDEESEERGQGRALRAQDPFGLPIEFVHKVEQRERMLQQYDKYRGGNLLRIDHYNCQVTDVTAAYTWWTKNLGFWMSEYTVTDDDQNLWAAWLHRKQNVHDIAFTNGVGPRVHHIAFYAEDAGSILRLCDILASKGMVENMERGPGRHGLSNAFFLYLRDPDGNRVEIYNSDYLIPDPDFEPIRWQLSDPRRATFWGAYAPKSWFEEASLVKNLDTGEYMPTNQPKQVGTPDFAD